MDTIFKPGQPGDQRAKVHAVYIFLSAVVSILTAAKNHYSPSPTSSSFIFSVKWRQKKKLLTTTQQSLIEVFPERLLERSWDIYLPVYVQFFLSPTIFNFLLFNAATEYN